MTGATASCLRIWLVWKLRAQHRETVTGERDAAARTVGTRLRRAIVIGGCQLGNVRFPPASGRAAVRRSLAVVCGGYRERCGDCRVELNAGAPELHRCLGVTKLNRDHGHGCFHASLQAWTKNPSSRIGKRVRSSRNCGHNLVDAIKALASVLQFLTNVGRITEYLRDPDPGPEYYGERRAGWYLFSACPSICELPIYSHQ